MTRLFEQAIEKVRTLPDERQDEVGEAILSMISDDAGMRLSESQIAEVRRRLTRPSAVATDKEVEDFFKQRAG